MDTSNFGSREEEEVGEEGEGGRGVKVRENG